MAVTSNRHGARLPFESVDEPSADLVRIGADSADMETAEHIGQFCIVIVSGQPCPRNWPPCTR
jgi:hypothetical protein